MRPPLYLFTSVLLFCPWILQAELTNDSTIVLVQDPTVMNGFTAPETKIRAMVVSGIKTLTGQTNEATAWRQLAGPDDRVAIKISTGSAPLQATRPPVVNAIVHGLLLAGVRKDQIVVFDRDQQSMKDAGYTGEGNIAVAPEGWDSDAVYENKIVGKLIWGDFQFGRQNSISTCSHYPRLLKTVTRLINVPVLQDHEACGLSGCLYNLSLGLVDNVRRFETYGQRGDPYIAEIIAAPPLRGKVVLNIMDALVAGYAGGPSFKPRYSWPVGSLYFSRDPVAVDAVALELLDTKRKEINLPSLGERATHVTAAERLGLGQAGRAHISLIKAQP